ncbi:MAG: D-TA family PLP-dependent enzyme [Planctomycetes bacterium]|nr:D-TA family PLP-dependent enzyme [Planctomycetota bacterium]
MEGPSKYRIDRVDSIPSPALIVFRDLVRRNIERMIGVARGAGRLRPHCKTHKMAAVAHMELEQGVTRHKCATIAEAEMLAEAGARDILIAYNMVGPNIERIVRYRRRYPGVELAVTADDPGAALALSAATEAAECAVGVMLDVDTGMHRTGREPGPAAEDLYAALCRAPGIRPAGLHAYDGQNHQTDLTERRAAVDRTWNATRALRDRLVARGFPVPRIVAGGTGSFPILAEKEDPALELSPGTVVFHDAGYSAMFPDLPFEPAALLLTRVVSRPSSGRLTVDLGYKAVAGDPPMGRRVSFPELPDAREVLHNEEHLVLESSLGDRFRPGDPLLAIPRHVCPTTALHQSAIVVADGAVVDEWPVTARDRFLHL